MSVVELPFSLTKIRGLPAPIGLAPSEITMLITITIVIILLALIHIALSKRR